MVSAVSLTTVIALRPSHAPDNSHSSPRMNTGPDASRVSSSGATRGLRPVDDPSDAVGDRSGTIILEGNDVLTLIADPLLRAVQEDARIPVDTVAAPPDITSCLEPLVQGPNEVVAYRNGSASLEGGGSLTVSPDPLLPDEPDTSLGVVLDLEQVRISPSSNSIIDSNPSIHGQNGGSGDQSGGAMLEDAIFAPASASHSTQALLVQNGPARSPGPPTGVRSVRGERGDMEDAVRAAHSFLALPFAFQDLHYFAVYDGHGGAQVAMHCREHMHLALAEEIQRGATPVAIEDREAWESYMKATFLRMDREVGVRGAEVGAVQSNYIVSMCSEAVGSTAVVAVLSANHIIVANCGDSRAVLCRRGQVIALSQDHKPDREDELARIEAAGGRVFNWNGWRVLGVLAMSRAIGDHYLKPYVIADPDMTMTARSEEDECLILASDGLWDTVSNQDACTLARRLLAANRDARAIASALVQKARERGSSDDISVVFVDLRRNVGNRI